MTDLTGQQFGSYRLTHILGRGGFADVYLGEHIHLGTYAAIKILQARLSGKDAELFRNEARLIWNLKHTNIIPIKEFGIEDDTPFLVMEYAPKGSLRQVHPKGSPVPVTNILTYVRQIAAALQFAHAQKLIHRDIKPENMLLGSNNEVLLSDFGLAIVIESVRAQSSNAETIQKTAGTIAYMAPEQIQGNPCLASDQYSLGIIVYEWLTGKLPFNGAYLEVAYQQVHNPPPPLRTINSMISADVEIVISRALAKDPQQRFLNVQAFATALEQALSTMFQTSQGDTSLMKPHNSSIEAFLQGSIGEPIKLGSSVLTIGRLPDNALVINGDQRVSGHHAEIRPEKQGYSIVDVGSRNGTFVNGHSTPITPKISHSLNDGDKIHIGDTIFTYKIGTSSTKAPDNQTMFLSTRQPNSEVYSGYGMPPSVPPSNNPPSPVPFSAQGAFPNSMYGTGNAYQPQPSAIPPSMRTNAGTPQISFILPPWLKKNPMLSRLSTKAIILIALALLLIIGSTAGFIFTHQQQAIIDARIATATAQMVTAQMRATTTAQAQATNIAKANASSTAQTQATVTATAGSVPTDTPVPTYTPTSLPILSSSYSGTISSSNGNRSNMYLYSVRKYQNGIINGTIHVNSPFNFSGTTTFSGSVYPNGSINFTIVLTNGVSIYFTGTINTDNSIQGKYSGSDQESGSWYVSPGG